MCCRALGEFLPISSSGHLIVVPWLMGWPDSGLAFDVALHLGTLAAVGFAFWRDWLRLLQGGLRGLVSGRPLADADARLLLYLALATVPGAVAGLLLDKWAETVFRSPALVSVMMALMGVVLWLADRRAGSVAEGEVVSLRDALLIGLAQALAIVPGTSRSGATISMALFLGHRREAAARFSFLLALPITAGAALVKVPALVRSGAEHDAGARRHAGGGRLGLRRDPLPAALRAHPQLRAVRRGTASPSRPSSWGVLFLR